MKTVDENEVQANFDYWIDRVAMGEAITISREGVPIAKLVAYQECVEAREPGCWAGRVQIAEDFDELPEHIARAFNGEGEGLFPSGSIEQSE